MTKKMIPGMPKLIDRPIKLAIMRMFNEGEPP